MSLKKGYQKKTNIFSTLFYEQNYSILYFKFFKKFNLCNNCFANLPRDSYIQVDLKTVHRFYD